MRSALTASVIAVSVAVIAAGTPIAAQTSAQQSVQRAVAVAPLAITHTPTASGVERAARVIATYHFRAAKSDDVFPTTVVVSDSAGVIVARGEMDGTRPAIPFSVTVIESNIVLQGQTDAGVLTLVLDGLNAGGEPRVTTGRWTVGQTEGWLRGRAPR